LLLAAVQDHSRILTPTGLAPPKYPENYDKMIPKDKAQIDELIPCQCIFYLYRVFNGGLNKAHLEALQDPRSCLVSISSILLDANGLAI
jgi:hypothetical protein